VLQNAKFLGDPVVICYIPLNHEKNATMLDYYKEKLHFLATDVVVGWLWSKNTC
jgi:hypothetical protein